jgi:ADP-dependent NAD(P)H-hydrate dehydratase / NAD(P)H-hydrate epimerase
MIAILSSEQMRDCDEFAINNLGISTEILMENAARSSAEIIIDEYILDEYLSGDDSDPISVGIYCGSGNNGGDGFGLARHLVGHFLSVSVYWIGSTEKMSPETKANFDYCNNSSEIECSELKSIDDFDLISDDEFIVDALLGVGGSENLHGFVIDVLEFLDGIIATKIAIDIPSGLNSDTGLAHDLAFSADLTITMFAPKLGLFLIDGIEHSGEVQVAYIGFSDDISDKFSRIFAFDDLDIPEILESRETSSSKFDNGRVTIIAGSENMSGAGVLCGNACVSVGAGLVHLSTCSPHSFAHPEIMQIKCESSENGTIAYSNHIEINKFASKSNVLAIGPGLGDSEETLNLIAKILEENEDKNIVLDADALRLLDENSELGPNFIITPHTGEMARITGLSREFVDRNRVEITKEWAKKLNCTVLLKGVPTIISDGETTFLNLTGNPALAKGGSGDVLTGIIAGLLAQGLSPIMSAVLGAYLHGKAADDLLEENNMRTINPSDIIEYLGKIDF